jgi:hypothetical protein
MAYPNLKKNSRETDIVFFDPIKTDLSVQINKKNIFQQQKSTTMSAKNQTTFKTISVGTIINSNRKANYFLALY